MSNKKTSGGILQLRTVKKRVASLLRTPLFWLITLCGNSFIFIGASVFHYVEKEYNAGIQTYLDSLNWAVGIVTTVGSSLGPVTTNGKIVSIGMMIGGALFLWSYMALFVGALVGPEFKHIEEEVFEVQREFKQDAREEQLLLEKMKKLEDEYKKKHSE